MKTANSRFSPYVGAAFEYEFGGKSRASAYGVDLSVPSLRGGSGVGELGMTMRSGGFSADVGVQGHVGRRDGVTGGVKLRWVF